MNGYKVIEGRVYKVNADAKKSEKIFCGNDIDIGGFENNVDQDIYYIWLKFRDEIHDKEVSIKMERDKINANTLTREIRKRGGVIVEGKSMLEYFLQKESDLLGIFRGYALKGGQHAVAMAGDKFEKMMQKTSTRDLSKSSREVKNCHTNLGWQTTAGNIVFRANRSISLDEAVEESEYDGRFRIEPQGSFDTVKDLFGKYVKDHIPLQVIAAIATAATFLGYTDVKWKMVIPNMVFSLNSKTSVGKSTALEFASSFDGFPDSKEDGAMCMLR
jgi:hypothetical protein